MFLINKVSMGGRIASDLTIKYTQSGIAVMDLSLGLSKKLKDGNWGTSFVSVKLFGKSAELVNQYLAKGSPLYVEGELKQERWEKDGVKHSKIVVLAHEIKFETREKGEAKSAPKQEANPAPKQEATPAPKQGDYSIPEVEIEDDEIPF